MRFESYRAEAIKDGVVEVSVIVMPRSGDRGERSGIVGVEVRVFVMLTGVRGVCVCVGGVMGGLWGFV